MKQTCHINDQAYACGEAAKNALNELIKGSSVRCEDRDVDRYGRLVAICFVGDTEVNEWIVRQGFAVAYRNYTSRYNLVEDEARTNKRGLWQGRFQYPWDYRHSKH
jgi:endonuclease YncB( thermonuclease family)